MRFHENLVKVEPNLPAVRPNYGYSNSTGGIKLKRLLNWRIVVAFIAAFALGTTLAVTYAQTESASVSSQAQSANLTNTITVNGSGQASGTPDVANVQLGIEVTNTDPGKALAQANDTISKVTKAVAEVGIAETDIQTSGFNLYPQNPQPQVVPSTNNTQPNSSPETTQTYQAQISISVQVKDISKVGAVIDAGTKAGANIVTGLTFGIADMSKLEQEARTQAVANAHSRAQQLAAALNMTLGDPITVNESTGGGVRPLAFNAVGGAATQVNPGQLNVNIELQITYSMSKK